MRVNIDRSAPYRDRGKRARRRPSRLRGFTLVELLTVVIIISVFAALAIPAVSRRMKDQRTRQAALRVATLYQQARLRAMGRGTAVLVRYGPGTNGRGRFEVHEAQTGSLGCPAMPVPSCSAPNWNDNDSSHRPVTTFDIDNRGEYNGVEIDMAGPTTLDVCFTPMGRTFARENTGTPLSPLSQVYTATVHRVQGGNVLGIERTVAILPSGIARLQ